MRPKKRIPWANQTPTGWWIASYVERFEFDDEPKRDLKRRCLAWKNTIIVKARDREQAFKKATAAGRLGDGIEGWNRQGRKGTWRFEGLTSLLPVYEELEDGAEVLWVEYERSSVRKIKSMVRPRKDLEAFDDREDRAWSLTHFRGSLERMKGMPVARRTRSTSKRT